MFQKENRSRRSLIKGAIASAAIVGFDLSNRRWLTASGVKTAVAMAPDFPSFEGMLYTDPAGSAQLDAAADDFGHIVKHRPIAVGTRSLASPCCERPPIKPRLMRRLPPMFNCAMPLSPWVASAIPLIRCR
jgi:hypothetical protein